MNNFLSNITGGLPLRLNDLRWIEKSIKEIIKGSFIKLNDVNYLWLGGNFTLVTNTLTISDGVVYDKLHDEMFYISGGTYTSAQYTNGPSSVYLTVTTKYDTDGNKIFKDGDSWQTYQIRMIEFGDSTSSDKYYNITLQDLIDGRKKFEHIKFDNNKLEIVDGRYDTLVYNAINTDEWYFDTGDTSRTIYSLLFTPVNSHNGVQLPGYSDTSLVTEGEVVRIFNNSSNYDLPVKYGATITTLNEKQGAEFIHTGGTWIICTSDLKPASVAETRARTIQTVFLTPYNINQHESWSTVTFLNGWTGALQYRRNNIGQLEFKGFIQYPTAGTTGTNIFDLPSGYRPTTTILDTLIEVAEGFTPTADRRLTIVVNTNGEVIGYDVNSNFAGGNRVFGFSRVFGI